MAPFRVCLGLQDHTVTPGEAVERTQLFSSGPLPFNKRHVQTVTKKLGKKHDVGQSKITPTGPPVC